MSQSFLFLGSCLKYHADMNQQFLSFFPEFRLPRGMLVKADSERTRRSMLPRPGSVSHWSKAVVIVLLFPSISTSSCKSLTTNLLLPLQLSFLYPWWSMQGVTWREALFATRRTSTSVFSTMHGSYLTLPQDNLLSLVSFYAPGINTIIHSHKGFALISS